MTEVKWEKTRSILLELETLMREDRVTHKVLDCIRGFLIYVAKTYKWMMNYLKGLHITIDVWREGYEKE